MLPINWYCTVIKRVIENFADNELVMEVDYPVNPDRPELEPQRIVFYDACHYCVDEDGPPNGPVTIEDVIFDDLEEEFQHIRITTNAGYRSLSFRLVELHSPVVPLKAE